MYEVIPYIRANRTEPYFEWLNGQEVVVRASVEAKVAYLRLYGMELAKVYALEPLKPLRKKHKHISGLYELKQRGMGWRIGVYHDRARSVFLLLNGWKKQRRRHFADVEKAFELAKEYIEGSTNG